MSININAQIYGYIDFLSDIETLKDSVLKR